MHFIHFQTHCSHDKTNCSPFETNFSRDKTNCSFVIVNFSRGKVTDNIEKAYCTLNETHFSRCEVKVGTGFTRVKV